MDHNEDSYISLNRLFFLPEKKLNDTAPFFVIEFVAKSIGVNYDFKDSSWKEDSTLVKFINNTLDEDHRIKIKDIETSLPDIASFVNPEKSSQWKTPSILIKAFWSIHNFTPKIPLSSDETFGYKTESNPLCIDPVMTYQIAIRYSIPFNRDTSLESLKNDIHNYSSKLTPLRHSIFEKIKFTLMSKNRKGLIEAHKKIETPVCESQEFPNRWPQTKEEAILRAAKEYRWDISMSEDPVSEYIELDRVPNDKFSPVDEKWRKFFDINRKYFHLDSRYIEKYSDLYTENKKSILKHQNGGSLKSSYLVLGLHPNFPDADDLTKCKTTINMDKISGDCIERYRTLISSPDFVCTRNELLKFWDYKKSFVSPNDSAVSFSEYHLDMIRLNSDSNDKLRLFIDKLRQNRAEIIEKSFEHCRKNINANIMFHKLMSVGMAIRGYKVCYDEHPLQESTYDIEKYQNLIELRTSQKYTKLINYSKDFFDKIPLFTGRNVLDEPKDDFKIELYGDGLSVGDILRRLTIHDKNEGCIRVNSNFILITSWYYLSKLYDDTPFDITKLQMIS